MRINTNISAINAHRNLTLVNEALTKSTAKLSSGFRITRAADDAAGLGIANVFRADTRALNQAARNAEQAAAVLNIAEGGATSIQKMLERMKELAAQAASDSVDSNGRTRITAEYDALRDEIDRTVATLEFQGNALLDGTFSGSFLVSSSGQYATNDTLTISGATLDLDSTTLTIAADPTTIALAQTALGQVDAALLLVNAAIGTIGSYQSRLEIALENVRTTAQNFAAAESTIRDVDMAQEMTTFTKNQILVQAGTAMLAQANQNGQNVLALLRA
ncbi:MAG: flagellin [Gemmatimonadota bacterium]